MAVCFTFKNSFIMQVPILYLDKDKNGHDNLNSFILSSHFNWICCIFIRRLFVVGCLHCTINKDMPDYEDCYVEVDLCTLWSFILLYVWVCCRTFLCILLSYVLCMLFSNVLCMLLSNLLGK